VSKDINILILNDTEQDATHKNSFVNVETKEQSKRWMHTHSQNKPKKLKQMSATKLMAAVFWDRKGVPMMEFMQQGTTITSEVYCETQKKLHMDGHSEQKAWNADIQCSASP
jgi:hypothetical protein